MQTGRSGVPGALLILILSSATVACSGADGGEATVGSGGGSGSPATGGGPGTGGAPGTGATFSGGSGGVSLAYPGPRSPKHIDCGHDECAAVRADGRLFSWRATSWGALEPCVKVAVDNDEFCALSAEGQIRCWGPLALEEVELTGVFSDLFLADGTVCGLDVSGEVRCGGREPTIVAAPAGPFDAISGGFASGCAHRTDDSVVCWGQSFVDPAPPTLLRAVFAGGLTCGIRDQGFIECWDGADPPPTGGGYVQVAGFLSHGCALHQDGHVDCWGFERMAPPETERFVEIAAAEDSYCGVHADGSVFCWGSTPNTPPADLRVLVED